MAAIKILGIILESLLLPFIDISLLLQQQIELISCYCHLIFTLFHTGNNDLEELFGITHMKGGHNSAMNYSQALDQIGAAKDVDAVFKKHLELNPGSCHLKLTSVEGLDHIHPDLWHGDIITSHCDFSSAWIAGYNKAIAALIDARMPADSFTFDKLFSLPGYDLMQPWRSNKYMRMTSDVEITSTSNISQPHASALPSSSSVISSKEDIHLEDDVLMLEEALTHKLPLGVAHVDSGSHIDFEGASQQVSPLVTNSGIHPNNYLLVDGNTLTIALHHATTYHETAIPDLCTPNVKLIGQISTLVLTHQPLAEQHSRLWSGKYVKTSSKIMGILKTTEKIVEITVPGLLVQLVNPDTTCFCFCDDVDSDDFCTLNNIGNTWVVGESALTLACDTLWSKASTGQLAASETGPLTDCPLCGTRTDSMQAHMGIYILHAFYGVLEDNLKELIGIQQPCSFCRQSE
ncbi:hypothetical protein BD769DRAFT_1389149 [Suillus cothurnatus]|nr:hypothetical protein BD769DRAFT_1389149 [Suillus cothurnatus]